MMRKIPILICIDVEPDARQNDTSSRADWKGFGECYRLFDEFRPRAERATGAAVHFNWFLRMDPQVALVYGSAGWAAERYGAQLESLHGAGDEIGLHTHAWRREGKGWVTDYGNQEWVNYCVRLSFETYERAFGRPCSAFRFGDHWMNNETFDLLERLGARYELTLEPGVRAVSGVPHGEAYTGAFPDYTNVPRTPYRPARADFRKRDDSSGGRGLWVVPVSTGLMPPWPKARFYRRAVWRVKYGRRDYAPFSLALSPPHFRHLVSEIIDGAERPYLCLVLRTDSAANDGPAACLRENLGFLLSPSMASRMVFETPGRSIPHLA